MIALRYSWVIAMGLVVCSACQQKPASHREMLGLLSGLRQQAQHPENPYANHIRALHYDSLARQHTGVEALRYQYQAGVEYLRAGKPSEAISIFHYLDSLFATQPVAEFDISSQQQILRNLALSYFRLGEQENCQHHHHHTACILPFDSTSYHTLPQGSSSAIQYYTNLLQLQSDDMEARWLLNLAHMTLGTYPDQVPTEYRIPPHNWQSPYPLAKFQDRAALYGVDQVGMSGGVIMDDFTGDGWPDIVASAWRLNEQLRFFVNKGIDSQKGFLGFSDQTTQAELTGITGGLNLVQADYNNDGWRDILILRGAWMIKEPYQPNSLLRNNGDGTFTDVTTAAGILSFHPTQTASWADFNLDGWLDLYIGNESQGSLDTHPCELYINQQDGTFREIAREARVMVNRYVKGVTASDYDRDGWPDIYVSTLYGQNYLFRNLGIDETGQLIFEDATQSAGLADPIGTFPTWFWDYDQDGWQDIFVCEFEFRIDQTSSIISNVAADYLADSLVSGAHIHLFRNQGDGTFIDMAQKLGLEEICYAMGSNFGDLDVDGWQDLYVGTGEPNLNAVMPNLVWRNNQGRYFQNVTTSSGLGHLQKGHGISFGDVDRDGDQDIYAVMGGAFEGDFFQNALFENPYRNPVLNTSPTFLDTLPRFISLDLIGTDSNRDAIGTYVKLTLTENDTIRRLHRWIATGSSFGANSLTLEVGLGKTTVIDSLEIHWPSQKQQYFKNVSLDTHYQLTEGDTLVSLNFVRPVSIANSSH